MFSPGVFDKGVFIPKDDKIPDPAFIEINLLFSFPHTEQIDFYIKLPFFVLKLLSFLFPVSLLQLTQ